MEIGPPLEISLYTGDMRGRFIRKSHKKPAGHTSSRRQTHIELTMSRGLKAGAGVSSALRQQFSGTRVFSTSKPRLQASSILLEDTQDGYGFVCHNPVLPKPRQKAVTEIRGPYYSVMDPRYLSDVLDTMGTHVDGLKFAGGSFSLFPQKPLCELIDLAHAHGVYVSTGGWMEHILSSSGADTAGAVDKYLAKCKDIGFDVIEISTGFLSLPGDDWLRVVDRVHAAGIKAKPELGIQFGAGGDTTAGELANIGTSDPTKVINMAHRFVRPAWSA